MPIQSVLDFPIEIKKIVELFYTGHVQSAYDEAYRMQDGRADLALLINCLLSLFKEAPPTLEAFNEELLLQYRSASHSGAGFEFGEALGDLSSDNKQEAMGPDELRFHAELAETLAAETRLPAILSDSSSSRSSGRSSGFGHLSSQLSMQEASNKLGQDIDIDIDIELDQGEEEGELSTRQRRDSRDIDAFRNLLQTTKTYATPMPRAPITASQSVPSIMRATQASQGRSVQDERKLARKRTLTQNALAEETLLSPLENTKARQDIERAYLQRQHAIHQKPTVVQMEAINNVTQVNLEQVNSSNKSQKVDTLRDIDADSIIEKASISALKPLNRTPVLRLTPDELSNRRDIDAKAGYILSQIDGATTLLDIIDISNWSASETTEILAYLLAQKIIAF